MEGITGSPSIYAKMLLKTAKGKIARELATWWEEHLVADMKREKEEKERRQNETLRKKVLSKLTSKERKVLGLS